jgi:PAS domain S-box-containing protein
MLKDAPMKTAPLPPNEEERLRLLRHLEKLDAGPEELFDSITRAIMLICDVPVALVNLTDDFRQWFKPKVKPGADAISKEASLCAQMMPENEPMLIPDALKDKRFASDLRVSKEPGVRFYAAIPLKLTPKTRAGTLCVMDYRPRILDGRQLALLELLAGHIVSLIKLQVDKLEASREFSALVMVKQKLQFQKDLMEAILDNEPESVNILSVQGELEQINRAGLDMLEAASLGEARQRKLIDYVQPEFRDCFSELQCKVFRGEHATAEYKICGAKGTRRWMESHAAPLYNQQGEIINLIAISRDITGIKESQQRLNLAARVFTEAQEGIIITDANSIIVDVNPAFCAITGYSRDEVIGQTPRILQSGLQGPDFYAALWKTLIETGHWKGEIWSRKKDGGLYAELISISALRDEAGNAIYYVALFLDVTEIKRKEGAMPEINPG